MENISSEDSNSPNKYEKAIADDLRNDLGRLLTSELYADVEIRIKVDENGRSILAHSIILAARSKVFAAKIRHSDRSKMIDLEIDSYSFDIISAMINFIYTGKTSGISLIADELLQAAHEYDLPGLKYVCEKKCLLRMNVDSVINFLCIADIHKAELLKGKAMEYIKKNFDEVIATDGWKNFEEDKKHFQLLADLCKFVGSPEKKRFRASTSND